MITSRSNNWGGITTVHSCRVIVLVMFGAIALFAPWTRAFDLPVPDTGDPSLPWDISADHLYYEHTTHRYMAQGNVVIARGDKKISADRVAFDHKQMTAMAEGNVLMTSGDDVLTGDRLEIDLNNETGTLYKGTVFIQESNFHFQGDRIAKTGPKTYEVEGASASTCDGQPPPWKITARKLRITIDGYGFATHASFQARNIPIMYLPVFGFPVKFKRQSGLLVPKFGYSDRKGTFYQQPMYWAINEWSDATFYGQYMGYRGLQLGLEYRYVRSPWWRGGIMFDYLRDRQIDDGSPEATDNWGYEYDSANRTNSDRYWFRMKHDFRLPYNIDGNLDVDLVSDQDYLPEFKSGYTGFDDTESFFFHEFGRDMNDYNDVVRKNTLLLARSKGLYHLTAGLSWYDNVLQTDDVPDTELHRLPFVEWYAVKQRVKNLPLYWNLESGYDHYYRENGTTTHRLDVYPRLYYCRRIADRLTLEPSVGFRGTLWQVKSADDSETVSSSFQDREMIDLKLDLYSSLFRVFHIDTWNIDQLRHVVYPRIIYEYIPDTNQDELPYFDTLDRIEKKHVVSFSLTNFFTAQVQDRPDNGESSHAGSPRIFRFCRFKLEQTCNIDGNGNASKDGSQYFNPLYAEIELTPISNISMKSDMEWSHEQGRFLSRNILVTLKNSRGDRLSAEHRYTRDSVESIKTSLNLKVMDHIRMVAGYERNIRDGMEVSNTLGMIYKGSCWMVDLRHTRREDDHRYTFVVNLSGLGEIGGNI